MRIMRICTVSLSVCSELYGAMCKSYLDVM